MGLRVNPEEVAEVFSIPLSVPPKQSWIHPVPSRRQARLHLACVSRRSPSSLGTHCHHYITVFASPSPGHGLPASTHLPVPAQVVTADGCAVKLFCCRIFREGGKLF